MLALVAFVWLAFLPAAGAGATNQPAQEMHSTEFKNYAGSQSCANCHQDEYKQWQTSHHGLAERLPSAAEDQRAFVPTRSFLAGIEHSTASFDGTNYQITSIGLSGSNETHAVVRVIGENPLRQFLINFADGRLQTMEASYDPRSNQWFNVFGPENRHPGEWGHWTGRGMNWNDMCAVCHNTRLQKNYDAAADAYHTTMAERSVGCEACHGPLQNHVDWQNQYGKTGRTDPTLPKFSHEQTMDNCAWCHSRRTDLTGDFQPGDALLNRASLTIVDTTDTYYPDGQIRDEDYEYTAFLGSRMHAAGVYCMDCHNPHSAKTKLSGNLLCLRCHNGSYPKAPVIDPVAHSHHKVHGYEGTNRAPGIIAASYDPKAITETGGECINCHMPQTVYMQRHWRHDHGFTSPDPLLTKSYGIPNACNRCHTDQTADWALTNTINWYGEKMNRPARARAELLARAKTGDTTTREPLMTLLTATNETPYWQAVAAGFLGQWVDQPTVEQSLLQALQSPSPLVREQAARALEQPANGNDPTATHALNSLLADPSLAVRIAAAWDLKDQIASNSPATGDLEHYLNLHADQPQGQVQLGDYAVAQGRLDEAADHFRKAVAWDSDAAPFHHDFAIVLSMQGKTREAVDQLEAACRLEPNEAEYEFKLGLAWNELEDLTNTIAALKQAVALNPHHVRAWYNLGLAESSLGDTDAALAALQRAADNAPDSAEITFARATILYRLGRIGEARAAANQALEIDPNNTQARDLLNQLSGQ